VNKTPLLVLSVGSFFSYVNDARSHEPEETVLCSTENIYIYILLFFNCTTQQNVLLNKSLFIRCCNKILFT